MSTPALRLAALRETMKQRGLAGWIIPSADPHLSEYLPEHWQTRSWLSGFTGSAGTLVVSADEAALWADSRYWEQAEQQLAGSGIVLEKLGLGGSSIEWLAGKLPQGAVVGVAPDMLSLLAKRQLQSAFAEKKLVLQHQEDLVDAFWHDRPTLPQGTIYIHPAEYTAQNAAEKLAAIRAVMQQKQADCHLISSLDDIAWITNLRGNDVSYNPVFLSHLLINAQQAVLFVDESKLDNSTRQWLADAGICTADYHTLDDAVGRIRGTLLISPAKVAVSSLQCLSEKVKLIEDSNPSTLFKAEKSPAEIEFVRQAMREDGIALCGFFAEFEQKLAAGVAINELDVSDMLIEHRSRRAGYVSPSFGTIAGFNTNGALPHYSATPEAYSEITGDGLLLIDSGAQYFGGTTDITRVLPIGTPTAAQKRDFTLVLKAHIALARAVFPENLPAPLLDTVCRMPLWQSQLEYGHGTGHGVGYFLNVHEGPQSISYRTNPTPETVMKVGMITSNEPGLYRPRQWGIRIENLVVCQAVEQPAETAFGKFLHFETLTLCPIDTRLIDPTLLNTEETEWLNRYHASVREKLEAHTEGAAKAWLIERTQAI